MNDELLLRWLISSWMAWNEGMNVCYEKQFGFLNCLLAEFYSDSDILFPNMNRLVSLRPALSVYQWHTHYPEISHQIALKV